MELVEVTVSAFVRTCGLEQGDVVGSSEHGKESSGSITCREFFVYLRSYYLLIPWSRVLLEKLTVNFAASQEIPRIYGTRKSLTVPTSARHLSLS
jgi:hypothetical protein